MQLEVRAAAVIAPAIVTAAIVIAVVAVARQPDRDAVAPRVSSLVAPPVAAAGLLAPPAPHALAVTLERAACYGTCPVYRLAIYRDGVVEYAGEHFVKTRGAASWRVPPEIIAALDLAFAHARFAALDGDYTRACMTDSSSATVTYARGAAPKRVEHYHGACDDPARLTILEDAIDLLVGTERVIGTDQERAEARYDWAWF